MAIPLFRRAPLRFLLILILLTAAGRAGAELVWTPKDGWKIEGGALATTETTEAKGALGLMNKARAAEEKGRRRTALKYYKRVTDKYPHSLYSPEAFYRIGKLRLARKQYLKSFEAFQSVATRYPATTRFNEIIGTQYHIAASLLDGARGRFFFGLLPGPTNREKAVEFLEILLLEAPYSDYAPLALMNVASAHLRFNNTEEAIDALDRFVNTYSQSLLMPDAYLALAKAHASLVAGSYYDQGSTRESITYYEDFLILFPGDHNNATAEKGLDRMKNILADSKVKLGDYYFKHQLNFKAARVFYNEAITVYPDSKIAAAARERLVKLEEAAAKPPAKKKKFFFF